MYEGTFEALMAVGIILICAGLAHAINKMEKHREESISRSEKLREEIGTALNGMVGALDMDLPDIHDIKDTIEESIQGIMGQMHVPTGQDMVLGALSQFVMSKIAPQMPPGLQNLAESVLPVPIVPPDGPESPN